jgi:hypothetical protein
MGSAIPFDAITTLLVFMVGVPAVVLQTLPPEVRQVVTKRWERLLASIGLPVLAALLVVAAGLLLETRGGLPPRILWSGVIVLLFATVLVTAFRMPRNYGRRDAVVRQLEREVGRRIAAQGRLVEESLHDLIELGKQSEMGREKQLVLEALLDLADAVCSHPGYEGDRLEELVLGLVDILPPTTRRGSLPNFAAATQVLRTIVTSFDPGRRESMKQVDLIHAIRALSTLGRASLALGTDSAPLSIVQTLGSIRAERADTLVSQALFEIGVEAIRSGSVLVAMACLSDLITLVESRSPASGELAADTLGLLAHFWSDGETGHEYARVRLDRIRDDLEEEVPAALAAAAEHCARTTQFRTADLLRTMQRDLSEGAAG